jgi:hypothetical protein
MPEPIGVSWEDPGQLAGSILLETAESLFTKIQLIYGDKCLET